MKRILVFMAAVALLAPVAGWAQKKGMKEVSPFVEGRQKVRQTDYDTIYKFTTFDQKKVYYLDFDYARLPQLTEKRRPAWGNMEPVMNFLTTAGRTPLRICALWAVNPSIDDPDTKSSIEARAQAEALESLKCLKGWMADRKMKNKVQMEVAQVDYRYWQGNDYFVKEQTQDELVRVGVLLFFGTKKINLFHNIGEGAQEFADVKFFPNDATVQPSWESYLDELAEYLKQDERLEVLLQGYTDNQGTEAYCTGLARQRCVEIKKKLVARGIAEHRIEMEAIGSADPIGDNATLEGRVKNNRVAVTIQ